MNTEKQPVVYTVEDAVMGMAGSRTEAFQRDCLARNLLRAGSDQDCRAYLRRQRKKSASYTADMEGRLEYQGLELLADDYLVNCSRHDIQRWLAQLPSDDERECWRLRLNRAKARYRRSCVTDNKR